MAFDTQNGTGDEIACVKFLADSLGAHKPDGLIVETAPRSRGKDDSGYVLASWGQPQVLLNVHIDTVPAASGWKTDPHTLTRVGDNLIGLGSSDIKGAAACILAGLEAVTPKNVAILFSGDEELGSEIMPQVIARGHYGNAPLAIVCEPTSCKVGRRHRGMLAFSAEFSGIGGHSSLADHTEAPLLMASRLAAAVGDYGAQHLDFGEDPYKGLCTNIGKIESDGAYNVIPTQVKLDFSMRPPPGDDVGARETDIRAIHAELCPESPLDTLVALQPFASHNVAAFTPYTQDTEVVDLPYWTEAAMLSQAGLNVIVYGPGDVDQAHKPNECVSVGHLSDAIKVYKRALSGGT